jgi:dihydrofolate reductase
LKNYSISLLAAYTKNNRVIGSQGKIPWNIPSERNRFKSICSGKKIIMGRKSFEEIGHALSYCTIVIISKTKQECPPGCMLFKNLKQAIKSIAEEKTIDGNNIPEILICGGERIYRQTIKYASRIYATEIYKDFDGDRYFPALNKKWTKTIEETREENGIKYDYVTYIKK